MDSVPGKEDNFKDSVLYGSEPVDEESIESIKAKEAEILKKLTETKTEKKKIKASLNVQRERIINKLKSDYEVLQKTLREVQVERDTFEKELIQQKEVVRYSFKEKQQLVEDLERRCSKAEQELREAKSKTKSREQNEAEKADMEKKYNEYIHRDRQHIQLLEATMTQLQKSNELVEDKFRKANKEIEHWKDQLQQLAEDNVRQEQNLSEEVHRLHRENKELKSRVNELAGAKLMDNNSDIADLSDPNRALKLGERFANLYDDEWTDAYQTYTEKFSMKKEEAIQFLLQILQKIYEFCRKVADEQMDCLCNVFENPCQDILKALTMRPQKEKTQITQKHYKDLKDLRKEIGLKIAGSITKQYVSKEYEEVKKGDKKSKSMLDETKDYYEKCVEVCWPMVLHDPPVRMEYPIKPGIKIDGNRLRLYGGNGDVLEYLVWPPLLLEGGGLLAKGVAKPKKTPRTVKRP